MKGLDLSVFYRHLIAPVLSVVSRVLWFAAVVSLAFLVYCLMKYHLNPFRLTKAKLLDMKIRFKPANFIRWILVDQMEKETHKDEFREYGLTLFCGRQGSGKTISMVHYLNRIHHRYPDCIIVTNFDYVHADQIMTGWRDFLEIRNGTKGVVFAIDEIHSEYSSASWKDFPESLLSEISQQRKQRVKIVASSQVYGRVVKPLREQTFSVVLCSTLARRWTFNREYDARDYEVYCDSPAGRKRLKTIRKTSFVQSDYLRRCYDTYAKIERLQKLQFIPRDQRGSEA